MPVSCAPGFANPIRAATPLTQGDLRTSNPIESVFATVRHRTVRTKGALSQDTARLMVFKLVMAAAKTWRRLKGENQLPKVVQGVTFTNGVEVINTPAHSAA
jgi:putative transposase